MNTTTKAKVWDLIAEIPDPKIPVVSILELGILRDVKITNEQVTVFITPTYEECPAIDFFKKEITHRLNENGFEDVKVETQLAPNWTSNWMDIVGKEKLRQYGIAPPLKKCAGSCGSTKCKSKLVRCPHCKSRATVLVSEIGKAICTSSYTCVDCATDFEYFKSV